ncbi:MAG: hypothetical protein P8Y63_06875 [Deltaproteobacteria bacterium]|jgi:hypothetical protein
MNHFRSGLSLLLFLLLLPHPARAAEGNFVLLYSNDVHGETAPCG